MSEVYLAVDLGATSGRVIAGIWNGTSIRTEMVHRFPSYTADLPNGRHWDIPRTYQDILTGLRIAAGKWNGAIRSIAVDSWGVDYGLLDERGDLIALPWMYRDARTDGWMDRMFARMPRREIYDRTGIQFLPFNTLYQLAAEFDTAPALRTRARRLLFIPDLIVYWLTGEAAIERTIAGTSQLLKAGSPDWDPELVAAAEIPTHLLQPVVEPGRKIGNLLTAVREKTGLAANVTVMTCAAHDTASAVLGVPSTEKNPLFLSSGTWSLIGRELDTPIITDRSYEESFSNEHGAGGTTRFLKNISGMWLVEECLRIWRAQNEAVSLPRLLAAAASLSPEVRIDPNAPEFLHPADMPASIEAHLAAASRRLPPSREETVSVVLHSLADCYADMTQRLREMTGTLPDTLHIVGGGAQNRMLNQLTANTTGLRVVAGPTEATALGNILAQLLAAGEVDAIVEGRGILKSSIPLETFEPTVSTVR